MEEDEEDEIKIANAKKLTPKKFRNEKAIYTKFLDSSETEKEDQESYTNKQKLPKSNSNKINSQNFSNKINSNTPEETLFSSPNKNYINSEYEPSLLLYEVQSNCLSEFGNRLFTSENKKYASDDDRPPKEIKKKKVFLCKSSKKEFDVKKHLQSFKLDDTEIKKLRRDLLNRKTKRTRNLKKYASGCGINSSSFKKKLKFNSEPNPKNNSKEKENYEKSSKLKKFTHTNDGLSETNSIKNRNLKTNDSLSVSNLSSNSSIIIAKRRKNQKNYVNSIKNYFSTSNTVKINIEKPYPNNKNSINKTVTNTNSILSYFPQVTNANTKKESDIVKTLCRLISNSKYNDLLSLIINNNTNNMNVCSQLINNISGSTALLINKSNHIDSDVLDSISLKHDNYFNQNPNQCIFDSIFQINDMKFDFINDPSTAIKNLFEVYTENTSLFIQQISLSLNFSDDLELHDNEKLLHIADNIKKSENLIKYVIKNYSTFPNFSFNVVTNKIKDLYMVFLSKFFPDINNLNYMEEAFAEPVIERLVAFLMIIKVIYSTCESLQEREKEFLRQFKESTINFIKLLTFIILMKFYLIDVRHIKNFTDQFIYVSLLQILSEIYATVSTSINSCLNLMNLVFKDYLNPGINVNTLDIQTSDIKSAFIENCKKLLFYNYFDQASFNRNLQFLLYKTFICVTNQISTFNFNEYSSDLKKLLMNCLNLQLYTRYLNIFIMIFCSNKNTNNSKSETNIVLEDFYTNIFGNCNIIMGHTGTGSSTISSVSTLTTNTYYDMDTLLRTLDSIEIKKILNFELRGNLLRRYILSDIRTILTINKFHKLESETKMKIIFLILGAIGLTSRKNVSTEEQLSKKNIYLLLDIVFDSQNTITTLTNTESPIDILYPDEQLSENSDLPLLSEFLLNVCLIMRNILTVAESDEKCRKRFLSKFISELNKYRGLYENAKQASIYENKLGIVPIFAIVLSLIEFTNLLQSGDTIRICVEKICQILDSDKNSSLLKGFSIAILLRIITSNTNKSPHNNTFKNISNLFDLLNDNINSVISRVNEFNQVPNMDNIDRIKDEHLRTLEYFLNKFLRISVENYDMIITNTKLIDVFITVVSSNNINNVCKRMVFTIIENTITNLDKEVQTQTMMQEITLEDGTIVCLEMDTDQTLNQTYSDFLKKIKNSFVPLMESMIKSYFFSSNSAHSNNSSKSKISLDLLKSVSEVYAKLEAILIRYSLSKCSSFFASFSYKSNFYSPIITKPISLGNKEIYMAVTFIPFKAFATFVSYSSSKCFEEILFKRDYPSYKHFIRFYFYSLLFTCSTISRNFLGMDIITGKMNKYKPYIEEFYMKLSNCRNLIIENLKNSTNKEECSYYILLLFILDNHDLAKDCLKSFDAIYSYMIKLFTNVITVNKNHNKDKIESKYLLDMVFDIDDIIVKNLYFDNCIEYVITIRNVFFKILKLFSYDIIYNKIDENFKNFICKFTKLMKNDSNFIVKDSERENFIRNKDYIDFVYLAISNSNSNNTNLCSNELVDLYFGNFFKYIYDYANSIGTIDYINTRRFSNLDKIRFELKQYLKIAQFVSESDCYEDHLLQTYYLFIYSVIEEYFDQKHTLDWMEIEYSIRNLIILINTEKFKVSKTDSFFIALILEKLHTYFNLEAEFNKENFYSKIFVEKLLSVLSSLIDFTFKDIKNRITDSNSLIITDRVLNSSSSLLIIFKQEFFYDNSDKFEVIKNLEYKIHKMKNNLSNYNKMSTVYPDIDFLI